jgi:hypothetical protein
MKYNGHYWWQGYKVPDGRVTEAILMEDKLSLDFEEDGHTGHLKAKSIKGDLFEGTYSYHGWPGEGQFSFRIYRSGERVLLFGTFYEPPTGDVGIWVFVLDPLDENKTQIEQQE